METIGIIGGGGFGSALADILGSNGHPVAQWFRSDEAARNFNQSRENAKHLPGFRLNGNITATADLEKTARAAQVLFLCVPSPHFRDLARRLAPFLDGDEILVSTTKGIEAHSFKLMTEILLEETPCAKIGALSGPNLAREIAAKHPAGTVIASAHEEVNAKVQSLLSGPYFRVYSNPDMRGVELGGVLKNIYAIATGLASALEIGDNAKGMIITRALAEMSRLAVKMGAQPLTFLGLAGVGDLVATCYSPLSRNFRVGQCIGRGMTLQEAVAAVGETAEGVHTIQVVKEEAAALGIRMHILEGLHALLFEGMAVPEVVQRLMTVPQMEDVEFSGSPGPKA